MSPRHDFDTSTAENLSFIAHLPDPHLTRSKPRLFPRRSRRRSLTNAPRGGLQPPSARRLWRANQPPSPIQHRDQRGRQLLPSLPPRFLRSCSQLTNKRRYLDYPKALKQGWPIATGVIEGACRHLVKDRMDITGARWGLDGAEAILKLRALRSNGDWDQYWTYHLSQEHHRIHETRYANEIIPQAA